MNIKIATRPILMDPVNISMGYVAIRATARITSIIRITLTSVAPFVALILWDKKSIKTITIRLRNWWPS